MSDRLSMSLDASISKRKGDDRGEKGRRDSGKPFPRKVGHYGRKPFGKPFPRFSSRRFPKDRRDRGDRDFRDRREKFSQDRRPSERASKPDLKRRFIRRTGAAGPRFKSERPRESETRPERRERPISERRRLRVSNLDFNITHKDLTDLFAKLGTLTKNKIEYDDLGRSQGAAMIEYEKHESAAKAISEYDGAVLDGKTITVEFDDDAKKRTKDSNIQRKTISKDFGFDRDRRRSDRFERSDRSDRFERSDRFDRSEKSDRFERQRRDWFRKPFRREDRRFRFSKKD